MLTVSDLSREFECGDGVVTAVDGVSFTLERGVFAAVIGRSGSGKSTLLSLLGTLDTPSAGSVTIDGADLAGMTDRELTAYRRDRIGFVFQCYNLIPNLTALQNVMLPMEFAGMAPAERRERAVHLLDQVGLTGVKQHRKPGRLSGGEQQRVAIARAMANKPVLILADEPTGNLDSETGQMIVELLRGLARSENATILAVTHDADIAKQADVTFRLKDGRLVETAFPNAVERSSRAYEKWLKSRDDRDLAAFAKALSAMIAAAPADRRLSPAKIRARFEEAAGLEAFEAILERLDRAG